jgi:hypothetical protein
MLIPSSHTHNVTPSKVKLIIHHQFPGVELVSPFYDCYGATCYILPDQSVDVGSTTQAGFNIDHTQSESIGILMYKLQRKNADQSDEEIIFSEDQATYLQLAMVWEINRSKVFHLFSRPIKHDKSIVWDGDNLVKLISLCRAFDLQHGPIEETHLIYDNMVLMTTLDVTHEECYKVEMTISEGSIKYNTWKPRYIGLNR